MCDHDSKGYITSDDLKNINSDPVSMAHILSALRLGFDDSLNFQQFLSRVRGLDGLDQEHADDKKLIRSIENLSSKSETLLRSSTSLRSSMKSTKATLCRAVSASDVFATETVVFASADEFSKFPRVGTARYSLFSPISFAFPFYREIMVLGILREVTNFPKVQLSRKVNLPKNINQSFQALVDFFGGCPFHLVACLSFTLTYHI